MLKLMRDNLKNLKWILWFVVFVFVLLIFVDWGSGRGQSRGMAGVAAKVGGAEIREADFLRELRVTEDRYKQQYGDQWEQLKAQVDLPSMALQNMIDRQLMLGEARRMGLGVNDDEVLAKVMSFPGFQREGGGFVGGELYARILRANQTTPEEFEAALRQELLLEKMQSVLLGGIFVPDAEVQQEYRRRNETASFDVLFVSVGNALERVNVTDDEARAYYDKNPERFTHGEQRRLRYLLVDTTRLRRSMVVPEAQIAEYYQSHQSEFQVSEEVKAQHILIRPKTDDAAGWREAQQRLLEVYRKAVQPNADFAALAREYSEDEGSKASGGDLGWFGRGRMVKEFEDAVFNLERGNISQPVKSQFGYHIIKLEDRRPSGVRPLDEVREQVRERVAEGLADAEGSRRAAALRERLEAGKLVTEEQWRTLSDDIVTSNITPFFNVGEPVPGLGREPEFINEIAAADEGFLGGPRRTTRGWVVYRVTDVRKPGTLSFEEAKDEARDAARRAKAVELLRRDVEARRASLITTPFATVASQLGGTSQVVTAHQRGSAIPGLGVAQALEDAVFATPIGSLTPVVTVGERGAAVAKVTANKLMDPSAFENEKASLRTSMVQTQLQQLLSSMLGELKRENPPVINPDLLARFKPRGK